MRTSARRHLFLGGLHQEFVILADNQVCLGRLGGSAAFAAAGARIWSDSVGLIARVGCDFPAPLLEQLAKAGVSLEGVTRLAVPCDARRFHAYLTPGMRMDSNPASHFLRIGVPFPKDLLGYQPPDRQAARGSADLLAVRPGDVPAWAGVARVVHIGPEDHLTHALVPPRLRMMGVQQVTLDPGHLSSDPGYAQAISTLVNGLDAFLLGEAEARAFFHSEALDLWEMAEGFAAMGCRFVVIRCGARGHLLWDRENRRRWEVPAYPAAVRDPTGAGDAFCGGFAVGLDLTGEALVAALWGSVSASLVAEGSEPFAALGALPGLAQARLDALRPASKPV